MRAGWTDHHPHTETNVVLDGRLHVECQGVTVVAGPGDTVQVPAGPCRPLLGTRVRADARRLRTEPSCRRVRPRRQPSRGR